MRNGRCEASFVGRLGLRLLVMSVERTIELVGVDGPHDREDLAELPRMTARFIEPLPLERLGKLLVGQDPFVDEVLAEGLNGRRLAEDPAQRVDEVDRAKGLDEVVRCARRHPRFPVRRAVARGQHHDGDRRRGRVVLEELADVESGGPVAVVEIYVQEHRARWVAVSEIDRLVRSRRFRDGPALRGKSDADHVAYEPLIVRDQDVSHRTSQRLRAYVSRVWLYSTRCPDLNSFATTSYALPARGAVASSSTAEERASAQMRCERCDRRSQGSVSGPRAGPLSGRRRTVATGETPPRSAAV